MSNGFMGRELLDALIPAVRTAWGTERVAIRRPRTRQLDLPYAVVWFEKFEAAFGGAGSMSRVQQTLRVGVMGRFGFPSDSTHNVELEKLDRANELVAALQTGPTFAGAILPLISSVRFDEGDLPLNAAYEVTAYFNVVMTASHH